MSNINQPITKGLLVNLRSNGIRIEIRHQRWVVYGDPMSGLRVDMMPLKQIRSMDKSLYDILPHGGETTVNLLFPDGLSVTGTALCSRRETFNRLSGIELATRRALAKRKEIKGLASFVKEGKVDVSGNSIETRTPIYFIPHTD